MRSSAKVVAFTLWLIVVVSVPTAGSAASGVAGGWDPIHADPNATSAATPVLNGSVLALLGDSKGSDLDAGGTFIKQKLYTSARPDGMYSPSYVGAVSDNPNAESLAALNPSAPDLSGAVSALAVGPNGDLYIGGNFTNAGGDANADYVAVDKGGTWVHVCGGAPLNGSVDALQIVGNTLYIGGTFVNGAGVQKASDLLACDLTTGAPSATVKQTSFNGTVYALTADSKGTLYAGGTFSALDGDTKANFVAYLPVGGAWHSMVSGPGLKGVTGIVRSLAANGTNVYVGTDALDVGGIPQADHVAKWNGTSWSALTSKQAVDGYFPASSYIYALAPYGAGLYAGGSFTNAGGDPLADRIAFYNGTGWVPVGSNGAGDGPLSGTVNALAIFDKRLYAGGSFTSAGGNPVAQHLASTPLPSKPLVAH